MEVNVTPASHITMVFYGLILKTNATFILESETLGDKHTELIAAVWQ